ncbi:hypothetical protein ACTMTJ_32005 [Phytohabitans sp. LJ34]|uniref:hypothetical protein n=1 Tax=Phytohabitans sp. LJ34 TaxID=3452217 RepID=UPI003F899352
MLVAAARRHNYDHLIQGSSRGRPAIFGAGLLAIGAGNLAGYLAVTGYLLSTTGPEATHGRLNVLDLLSTLAAVPLAVGLGAAAGRVLPTRLAPVAAAVLPYAIYMLLVYGSAYSGNIVFTDISLADDTDRTYLRLPTELVIGRGVFWLAVGAALICWALHAGRSAYTAVLIAGFGASAVLLTAGTRYEVPSEHQAVCVEGRPTVCLDRAHDHLVDEYVRRVRANAAALSGIDFTRLTVTPIESFGDTAPVSGEVVFAPIVKRNTSPAHQIDSASFDAAFGAGLFLTSCHDANDGERPAGAEDSLRTAVALYHWWLSARDLPLDGSNYPGEIDLKSVLAADASTAAVDKRLFALSPGERMAWLREHQAAILSCRAGPLP